MNIEDQPKIFVAIRKRPLNKKQVQKNQPDIVQVKNEQTVIVSQYKQKVDLTKYIQQSAFNFDFAFDQLSNNQQIYLKAVRPLVESAFMGAKVTCFAYGQTGSGKTYTMNGDLGNGVAGLYYLGANDIFSFQSNKRFQHLKIQVSFFEIYCSRLFDLLNNRNQLKLREDNKGNVHIVGLQQKPLSSAKQFLTVIQYGSQFRVTSQNSTNADSSRSHAILQITLKQGKKIYGKISFIDLAGCQRGADHMDQNKQTRIDGAQINKSLLSLKECIRALDQGKGHTPFRGSKLTMVLKDSFVGFCRTVMIGNISPNLTSCQNTLNTLRYADRVKQLKKPNSNQQLSKQDQLAKQLMLPRHNNNAVKIFIDKDDDAQDIQIKKQQAQRMLGIKNPQMPQMNAQLNRSNYNDGMQMNQGNNNNMYMNNSNNNNNNNKRTMNNPQNQYNNSPQLFPNSLNPLGKKISDNKDVRKFSVEDKGPERKFQQRNQLKKSFVQPANNKSSFLQDQKTVAMKANTSFQQNNFQQQNNNYKNESSMNFSQNNNNSNQYYQNQQQQQNNIFKRNSSMQSQNDYFNNQFQNYQNQNQNFNQNQNQNLNQNTQKYGQQQKQPQIQSQYSQQQQPFIQQQLFQPSQQQSQYSQPFNVKNNIEYQQNNMNFSQMSNDYGRLQNDARNQSQGINSIKRINSVNYDSNIQIFSNQQLLKNNSNNNQRLIERQFNKNTDHSWQQLIAEFREWNQNAGSSFRYYLEAHQYAIGKLMQQQELITQLHSSFINKQIQLIKKQTKTIGDIQQNKQSFQSLEYAQFIMTTIETKMNTLQQLKKKVSLFKAHLNLYTQIQQKIMKVKQIMDSDELLLEDIDNNQQYAEDNINNYMQNYVGYGNDDQQY